MTTHRILLAALTVGVVLLAGAGFRPAGIQPTAGGVYYVSPAGDDEDLGTITHPWRTIQHAADTLVPGDTVYIRA
ncbi:MAG: DUF5123 domain-containing protein, partial [Chloroflexi bacterium]|nr:DUF5123 domain-containing protein [Chloroflexota bacterium]